MDEKQNDEPIELEMTADRYATHDLGAHGCLAQIKGGRTWYENGWFSRDMKTVVLAYLDPSGKKGRRALIGFSFVDRRVDADTMLWVRMTPAGIEELKISGYFEAIADQAAQTMGK